MTVARATRLGSYEALATGEAPPLRGLGETTVIGHTHGPVRLFQFARAFGIPPENALPGKWDDRTFEEG
jgi:hypothetical protein